MGESRKLLASEKTRLPDVLIKHPKRPKAKLVLGHGAQLQARRLAMKAKAADSVMRA